MTTRRTGPVEGQPLTELQRMATALRAQGAGTPEISRELHISSRAVNEHLYRARVKMGARTLEQAAARFTEAQTIRGLAKGLARIENMDQLKEWTQFLQTLADGMDCKEPDALCVHDKHLSQEPCEDCLLEKPRTHEPDIVIFRDPVSNQECARCRHCRRARKEHGRKHRELKKEQEA